MYNVHLHMEHDYKTMYCIVVYSLFWDKPRCCGKMKNEGPRLPFCSRIASGQSSGQICAFRSDIFKSFGNLKTFEGNPQTSKHTAVSAMAVKLMLEDEEDCSEASSAA